MPYLPFNEQQIYDQIGKTYTSTLTVDKKVDANDILDFKNQHVPHPSQHARLKMLRLIREMNDDSSDLRAYLSGSTFARPLSLNMNYFELRQQLKGFEKFKKDTSNGWYSSTPCNIFFFYQMWTLEGVQAWKMKNESKETSKNHKSTKRKHEEKQPPRDDCNNFHQESCVVYMITNTIENNKNGNSMCYIGRTTNFRRRMGQHEKISSKCTLIRNAFLKYGVDAMKRQILVAGNEEDMKRCETAYITELGTIWPYGYNMKVGDTAGDDGENSIVPISTWREEGIVEYTELTDLMKMEARRQVDDLICGLLKGDGNESILQEILN